VHARSWIALDLAQLYNRYLGLEWMKEPANHQVWDHVEDILDNELWKAHETRRAKLIAYIRRELKSHFEKRGATPGEIKRVSEVLNPEYLTIGFARRFAAYKRGNLLFRDIRRLKQIINNASRPIQIVFAGKAHPRDNLGKELIKSIVHAVRDPELRDKIVFIENYDITTARYLVQGVDVWLNTPRRPLEASGTSGMKVVFNGGLNLSVLDGWWCEGYSSDVGWAIGSGEEYDNHDYQDEVEANALYDLLEKEVAPTFYDRSEDGIPRQWVEKMKASIRKLSPQFNSNRMVQQYTEKFYLEAYRQYHQLRDGDFGTLKNLTTWHKKLVDKWSDIRIIDVSSGINGKIKVDQTVPVEAKIFVGDLEASDIRVELYFGRLSQRGEIADAHSFEMQPGESPQAGVLLYHCEAPMKMSGRLGYSVRVLPNRRDLLRPHEFALIAWADDSI
jgi:starch phosphorylase